MFRRNILLPLSGSICTPSKKPTTSGRFSGTSTGIHGNKFNRIKLFMVISAIA
jgi:hypothetical protein